MRVYCTHTDYESYFPYQGFKKYFFPNNDLPNYQPPIVGVVFDLQGTSMYIDYDSLRYLLIDNNTFVDQRAFPVLIFYVWGKSQGESQHKIFIFIFIFFFAIYC